MSGIQSITVNGNQATLTPKTAGDYRNVIGTYKITEPGTYTIVATKVYLKNNLVKVEIALAKGKKLYDKKETLKQKAIDKDIKQATKNIRTF